MEKWKRRKITANFSYFSYFWQFWCKLKWVFSDLIRILNIFLELNTKSEHFLHIYPYLLRKFKYAYLFKARITFSAIKKKRTTFQMSDLRFSEGCCHRETKNHGFSHNREMVTELPPAPRVITNNRPPRIFPAFSCLWWWLLSIV